MALGLFFCPLWQAEKSFQDYDFKGASPYGPVLKITPLPILSRRHASAQLLVFLYEEEHLEKNMFTSYLPAVDGMPY